jgi:hypothetical protein
LIIKKNNLKISMAYKENILTVAIILGYLCVFMVIQDVRNTDTRNLGVGDGIYNRMDDICSTVGDGTGTSVVTPE